jgi:hypothetical protein
VKGTTTMRSVAAARAALCVVLLYLLLGPTTGVRGADNFVLLVNPVNGHGALRSDFPSTVWIDQYTITSINSLTPSSWNSLDDQNAPPGDWRESLTISAGLISESNVFNATSFQNGTGFDLGVIFNPASERNLAFQYRLAGSATPVVGEVSYEFFTESPTPPVQEPFPVFPLSLVYEGFNYPPSTNLIGAGEGFGFSAQWGSASSSADYEIGAGSLSYPKTPTRGNRVTTAAHNSGIGSIGRSLITPLGKPGTTQYVSFFVRPEGTLNEGQFNGFFGLRLETASGNDLFVGKPGGGAVDQFVLENAGGTLQHATGTTIEVGEEYLLVLRADFTTAGNDLFTLYVNPTPGAAEPTSGTLKNDVNLGMINEIFLYATGAFSIDEIRVGDSFAEVVPTIPGDYNLNGSVDADDYTVWRDSLGSPTSLPGDDTPGVGPDDYDRWKTQFGQTDGTGSGAVSKIAVPEPSSLLPLPLILAVASWSRRQESIRRLTPPG